MNNAALASVRANALRLGYLLRPIPLRARETASRVRQGYATSRQLANSEGIKIAAAHMRMRTAERLGLLVEDDLRPVPSGGHEMVWRLSGPLGIEAVA